MKFLFDLFPVALFFVAIQIWDIFVATAVAIVATVAQVGFLLLRRKQVTPMLWASLAIIVVFGGLTLYVRDKTFSEDLQQVRTGNQPNAYAAIRNLVTGAFRRAGFANIALRCPEPSGQSIH